MTAIPFLTAHPQTSFVQYLATLISPQAALQVEEALASSSMSDERAELILVEA